NQIKNSFTTHNYSLPNISASPFLSQSLSSNFFSDAGSSFSGSSNPFYHFYHLLIRFPISHRISFFLIILSSFCGGFQWVGRSGSGRIY
ncbi:hypothetical protein LINGRAHAP2_LOCUS24567, partial [Linum grandiflorum]